MIVTPQEVYVLYHALLAREGWVEDDGECSNHEELPFIKSLLEKISLLGFKLEAADSELKIEVEDKKLKDWYMENKRLEPK